MPLPKITHCLVSDAVRIEERGKISILGFFGVAPVSIGLSSFAQPIQLAFTFISQPGDGNKYKIGFELLADQQPFLPRQEVPDPLLSDLGKRTNFIFEFAAKFPGPGQYTARLYSDGLLHYEVSFELTQS